MIEDKAAELKTPKVVLKKYFPFFPTGDYLILTRKTPSGYETINIWEKSVMGEGPVAVELNLALDLIENNLGTKIKTLDEKELSDLKKKMPRDFVERYLVDC